ncbi:MAG: DUF3108 domain-containing protein [Smithella sp.]
MILHDRNAVILWIKKSVYRGFAKYILFVFLSIIFLNFAIINTAAKEPDKVIPFHVGEKLKYNGRWGIIPAGELTLEVLPKEILNGVESYHFVMTTKTSKVVDLVYKIRERQDSYVDSGMTRSVFYKKKTESEHPRDENIKFDWENLKATYTNFGETRRPINISPGTVDPLSLFYVLRYQSLKENSEIIIPMTDGNLNIEVRAMVGKRSKVEIGEKTYDTIEITPNMNMLDKLDKDKVVKKSDNPQLKIWVTADEKKIPIKIRTKVGIITFDFDYVPDPS